MLNAEKLKKIQEFIELSKSSLTEAEFVDAFKKVVDYVKAIQAANKDEMKALDNKYTNIVKGIESNYGGDMQGMKKEAMDYCEKEMKGAMDKMDTKMASLKDGVDGLSADVDIVAKTASEMAVVEVLKQTPKIDDLMKELPKAGDIIASALELLPDGEKLKIDAIQDLKKELDELRAMKNRGTFGGGGGFSLSAMTQHFIDDEVPANSGDDLVFTLDYAPSPATSLKVYLNGQKLTLTTDFTLSGKTLTLLVALLATDILTVSYIK